MTTIAARVRDALGDARTFLTRGRRHRERLADVDVRIAVTGTRGKSSTVTWLHDALTARGYDTYAKVTGEHPHSLYNGTRYPIERTGPVQLYETERELRRFAPADAIVVENQGIREYTTRLVNADYVDPTLVVLTNVRQDHLDTLGGNRRDIARALARSIPAGARVVSGERNEAVNDYLERELARRDATLVRALSPDEGGAPADELLAIVDAVLRELGADPLSETERATFRDRVAIEWVELPEGRVYNAANVNDVESTELVRRALVDDPDQVVQPLVYFRADRPGRTASFIEYLNALAARGAVEQVRALGAHRTAVTRALDVPVVWHDEAVEPPAEVLAAALADGWPVFLAGNIVPEFMQELAAEIERRATDVDGSVAQERPVAAR